MPPISSLPFVPALIMLSVVAVGGAENPALVRLKFNNPELVVDLGVGLWAWPMPMDYDGDGDPDLVVSCPDVPYNGTYFFENPGNGSTTPERSELPVFRPGVRIAQGPENVQVSFVDKQPSVLTPGVYYPEFLKSQFNAPQKLPLPADFHRGKVRANQWKFADYDGDGRIDLLVGVEDWQEYGWDNAFNQRGEWVNGPLRGYVYWARNVGSNQNPIYEAPAKLTAAGKPIDVYGMPSPNLEDFDGDRDLDILCGEFVDKFTYFENVGTRTNPRYAQGRYLIHHGQPLRVDLCMMVAIAFDWNRDHHMDLVVGQEDGRVMLIRHTGRVVDGLPEFEEPEFFQQQADDLKFGALATPVGVDWDSDGDEDIISGNTAGEIAFIDNLDGAPLPKWAAPQLIHADGKPIRIKAGNNGSIQGPCEAKWGYTTLSVADWDQDKLLDLVVNSILGRVVWYRNVGSPKNAHFAAAAPIEVEWSGNPPKPAWVWWTPENKSLTTQWRTTPAVIDFDDDGLHDLVMLDHEGYLAWFKRERRGGRLILLPPRRIFLDENQRPFRLAARSAGKSGRRKLHLTDWNRDGLRDLLVNSENVQFFRSTGWTEGTCELQAAGDVALWKLAGHDTCPTTVDWNGDGTRDLLIGAEDGHFYYLINPFSPQD